MSKEQSTIIKGVAILLMIFLHLFNHDITSDCSPLLFIGSTPFVTILTRACGPVPFFLIVSGYGLHYTYHHKGLTWNGQIHRILKLFITYWLVLAIFVSIGCFLRPDKYPGTPLNAFLNITSWSSSYNSPAWFLFPYTILTLFAVYIFKLIDKLGNIKSFILFCIIGFIAMYITSRYIAVYKIHDSIFAHIVTIANLSFSFAFGAILHRIAEKRSLTIEQKKSHQIIPFFCLIFLITIKCFIKISIFDTFYALFFILVFIQFNFNSTINKLLLKLGKYSMPMWLLHYFIYEIFFHDFIYGFKYPFIIFVVLVIISYALAIPFNLTSKWIIERAKL